MGPATRAVRPLTEEDIPVWTALRHALWPDADLADLDTGGRAALVADPPLTVFLAEVSGAVVGFLELSLRSYAEGCDGSPVPYVEGWYVAPAARGGGLGRQLMDAAARWSRERGFREIASDSLLINEAAHRAHQATGFIEVERIVVFRRTL